MENKQKLSNHFIKHIYILTTLEPSAGNSLGTNTDLKSNSWIMKIFCATDLTVKTGQLKLGFTTDLKFYSSSQNKEWIASNILFLTDLKVTDIQ